MPALLPSASQTNNNKRKQKPLNYLIYQQHQLYHPIYFSNSNNNNKGKHASLSQPAADSHLAPGSSDSDSHQETMIQQLLLPSDPPHISSNTSTHPSQPQFNLVDLKTEEEVDQLESDSSDGLEEEEKEGQGQTQMDGMDDGPEKMHGRETETGRDGMNRMMMMSSADEEDSRSGSHDQDDIQPVEHEPTLAYDEWDSQQASMLLNQLEQGRFFLDCLPRC